MNIDYKTPTELCYIMGTHGSDKGNEHNSQWHNYTKVYNYLFKDMKESAKTVFELGIGTQNVNVPSHMSKGYTVGGSIRGWREYFVNAQVYGADVDKGCLFEEERIKTFYCDQTNPETIREMWDNIPEEIDIIVEDGLHQFNANKCFFENSIHKLKVGGYFIIEDIRVVDCGLFVKQVIEWRKIYPNYKFTLKVVPHTNTDDNKLLIVHRLS